MFGGLFWPTDRLPSRKLTPCPEINAELGRLWKKYVELNNLDGHGDELKEDLRRFDDLNKKRSCGMEDPQDHGWVRAQDVLADDLAEATPKLVPSGPTEVAAQLKARDLQEILNPAQVAATKTTAGFVGYFSLLYSRWNLVRRFDASQAVRTKVRNGRRLGIGLSEPDARAVLGSEWVSTVHAFGPRTASIAASNRAVTLLTNRLKKLNPMLEELDKRVGWVHVYGLMLLFFMGMIFVLAVPIWSRWRDRRWLSQITDEKHTDALCGYLCDAALSERVRRHALRRIDLLGIDEHPALDKLEESVGVLLNRNSAIDRALAIRAAHLSRILGNRLRHRTIHDRPAISRVAATS